MQKEKEQLIIVISLLVIVLLIVIPFNTMTTDLNRGEAVQCEQ